MAVALASANIHRQGLQNLGYSRGSFLLLPLNVLNTSGTTTSQLKHSLSAALYFCREYISQRCSGLLPDSLEGVCRFIARQHVYRNSRHRRCMTRRTIGAYA